MKERTRTKKNKEQVKGEKKTLLKKLIKIGVEEKNITESRKISKEKDLTQKNKKKG